MANDEDELAKKIAERGAKPDLLRYETPVNGGQPQSAKSELVPTPPPEARSLGEPQFSMELHTPGSPAPGPGTRRLRWLAATEIGR